MSTLSNITDMRYPKCNGHQKNSADTAAHLSDGRSLRDSVKVAKPPSTTCLMPLKPCIKQKARSAGTTPPFNTSKAPDGLRDDPKLRRIKTVDFEKTNSQTVARQLAISSTVRKQIGRTSGPGTARISPHPGMATLMERSTACPAMTRTDVHVVAIAPSSLSPAEPFYSNASDQPVTTSFTTPTMQIIESNNSSYEVIWNEVPPGYGASTEMRYSSAGQTFGALSTGPTNLERVNTKLTEWSSTRNTPYNSYSPRLVVFPSDDGRKVDPGCLTVDARVLAPPNSRGAGATQSRRASAHSLDTPSQDESIPSKSRGSDSQQDVSAETEVPRLVEDPITWPSQLVAARQKLDNPGPDRKLSNFDELSFRGHRDSLSVAQLRLAKSSGLRTELFAHRDSVALAKERLSAARQRGSASRRLHRPVSRPELGSRTAGGEAAITPLSVVKTHAADALKRGSPTTILRP